MNLIGGDEAEIGRSPRVLVLLAAYNGAQWIEEQVVSVLDQRGVDVRVRVSDDQSNDRTIELLMHLAELHGNLDVRVRSSSSGSAGANFRSLLADADLSQAEFVAFCDQDDIWDPDHLARGCAALRTDGTSGYSCAVRTFGNGRTNILAQSNRARELDFLFEGAGQGCTFVLTQALAARVQQLCIEHPQKVSALHYHDWLVYLVARTAGDRWSFDAHPSLNYRQHGANEIGARGGFAAITNRLALIRRGWFLQQVHAALALATALTPASEPLVRFVRVFSAAPSLSRRVALAVQMSRVARRRRSDSAVLCIAALAGWL